MVSGLAVNRPPQSPTARKQTQRQKNRDWLAAAGWDGDAESLVTSARRGKVKLTIERNDDKNETERNTK